MAKLIVEELPRLQLQVKVVAYPRIGSVVEFHAFDEAGNLLGLIGQCDVASAQSQYERTCGLIYGRMSKTERELMDTRVQEMHDETEFNAKVYGQMFCRAHYALQQLAGNPIADEAMKGCATIRKTCETRRRNRKLKKGQRS